MAIDWSDAPEGAVAYAGGQFWKHSDIEGWLKYFPLTESWGSAAHWETPSGWLDYEARR